MSKSKIITVDGPAASGKSSVCQAVAEALGLDYVNTGLLYRAAGLLGHRQALNFEKAEELSSVLEDFDTHLGWDSQLGTLRYKGEDLSEALKSEAAGYLASTVAKNQALRQLLLPVQRRLAFSARLGAILDGRDLGTVVFPEADCKFFMTASLEKRAKRRFLELQTRKGASAGGVSSMDQLLADLEKRDKQDEQRGCAPLRPAEDAIFLDSTDLSLEEVVGCMVEKIRERISF